MRKVLDVTSDFGDRAELQQLINEVSSEGASADGGRDCEPAGSPGQKHPMARNTGNADEALSTMRRLLGVTNDPSARAQIQKAIDEHENELRVRESFAGPIPELMEKMKRLGGFREVTQPEGLGNIDVTYAVVQGKHLLTIGSGESKRLKTLMGCSGAHNKAPLIGLCRRLFSEPIRFFVCKYTRASDKNCSVEERELQEEFGETNVEGRRGYREAMRYVRGKLGVHLSEIENILLDLMETHGDVLKHALATESTAATVERLFNGYWKRSRRLQD